MGDQTERKGYQTGRMGYQTGGHGTRQVDGWGARIRDGVPGVGNRTPDGDDIQGG